MENEKPKMNSVKDMSPEEKIECAIGLRDLSSSGIGIASNRTSSLLDEFTRLEVQIATLLSAFVGIFLPSFNDQIHFDGWSPVLVFFLKLSFALSLFFLLLSLILGLIQIKRKERFWVEVLKQKTAILLKWQEVVIKESTFEEGRAYHEGTTTGRPIVIETPSWAWILQTICLGFAVLLLFILFLVFLFG